MPQSDYSEGTAVLRRRSGLHLRPAVILARLASGFSASISVRAGEEKPWTDAKSLVKIIRLKLSCNTVLQLKAEGADAQQAVTALTEFIERPCDD